MGVENGRQRKRVQGLQVIRHKVFVIWRGICMSGSKMSGTQTILEHPLMEVPGVKMTAVLMKQMRPYESFVEVRGIPFGIIFALLIEVDPLLMMNLQPLEGVWLESLDERFPF